MGEGGRRQGEKGVECRMESMRERRVGGGACGKAQRQRSNRGGVFLDGRVVGIWVERLGLEAWSSGLGVRVLVTRFGCPIGCQAAQW